MVQCTQDSKGSGALLETKYLKEDEYCGENPEYVKAIRKMCLFDDELMMVIFRDVKLTQLLVGIILDRDDLEIKRVQTQYYLKNMAGRSVRLDILATDADGKLINIEIQNRSDGAIPRRARFHSSLIDAGFSDIGSDFEELPETYVVFITRHDVLKSGKPVYRIDRRIEDTNELFDDGAHIIYVNGENKSDTELGRLIHDLKCVDTENFYHNELAQAVRRLKYTEEGVHSMCDIMEELFRKKSEQEHIQFAIKQIARGKLTLEEIAEDYMLPLDEVKRLAQNQPSHKAP